MSKANRSESQQVKGTQFERFQKFVRAVVAVPKKELPAQERAFQRAKKKRKRK